MSATGRKGKTRAGIKPRHARDYYPTPAWCVTRLLERIGPELQARELWRWCEPAVGNGAIVEAVKAWWNEQPARLQRHVLDFVGYDIEPQGRDVAVLCRKLIVGSFFESWIEPCDVMITNPPFVVCDENGDMVEGGLAFSSAMRGTAKVVIMLHRLDWLASAKRNEAIRAATPDVYVLPDRPSFTSDGSTDAQTYAWFVWGLSNGGRTEVLATTPIEERKAGKTMAPKSTNTPKAAKPTKAPKAPKRGTAKMDDAGTDIEGGGTTKADLERARKTAADSIADARGKGSKAKAEPEAKTPMQKHMPAADALIDDVTRILLGIVDASKTPSPVEHDEDDEASAKNARERLERRLVKSYPRLFKIELDGPARRKANDKVAILTDRIDGLRERNKREQKFVAAELSGYDAVVARARDDEAVLRKKRIAGVIGVLKAELRSELDAAANGYRWVEVECEDRADDHALKIFSYRLDTGKETYMRNMTEAEIKDAERRRQLGMRFER